MLKEGAKAGNITRIISEINDRLLRKIIEITEKQFGNPPVTYCWIVFGSEGRKEQTFKTDQDNAIIYADPERTDDAETIRKYFSDLRAVSQGWSCYNAAFRFVLPIIWRATRCGASPSGSGRNIFPPGYILRPRRLY